jgi:hypothetical protein
MSPNVLIAGLIAVVALSVTLTSPVLAQAASINECGNAGSAYGGAVKIVNVTSRNVGCVSARRFARRFVRVAGSETDYTCDEDRHCTWRGWSCTNIARGSQTDHRCTKSGGRVIRFQTRS